jgi:polyphosphate kinase
MRERFLEHRRLFAFGPDERAIVCVSSAGWMPRNFFRCVEVMMPVEDARLRQRLLDEVPGPALHDEVKARHLQSDSTHARATPAAAPLRSQMAALETVRRARDELLGAGSARGTALAASAPIPTHPEGSVTRPRCD